MNAPYLKLGCIHVANFHIHGAKHDMPIQSSAVKWGVDRPLSPSREVRRPLSPSREVRRPLSPSREARRPLSPSREVRRPLFQTLITFFVMDRDQSYIIFFLWIFLACPNLKWAY